jgi:hypothetical protein
LQCISLCLSRYKSNDGERNLGLDSYEVNGIDTGIMNEESRCYRIHKLWSVKCDIACGLRVLFIVEDGHANEEISDHKNESFEPVGSSVKSRQ